MNSNWSLNIFRQLLADYHDLEVLEWLEFRFSISRSDEMDDLWPNQNNHMGANIFPATIDSYVETEVQLGAALGPFTIPPFISRIGISPLSTRPKKDSKKRRVIMDLSFPPGKSVNDGISKTHYCGTEITLKYPTIDTLARRVAHLKGEVKLWKKDMIRAFRQVPLCPRDFSLIGYCWRNLLYFDKVVPMGLRSAAYICQRVTNAIVFTHNQFGYWPINYLDNFGSAERAEDAWASYNLFEKILAIVSVEEACEKVVPPTTRMEFLGNTVDTVKMTLEVSDHRKQKLDDLLRNWENKNLYRKKELQSIIGKMSFITNCVRPGRIFINRLLEKLRNCDDFQKYEIDTELQKDLNWWKKFMPKFDGISILWLQDSLPYDTLLASDVSMVGAGATHQKEMFHVKFPKNILNNTSMIAQREMVTIMVAIKLWAEELHGKVVRFYTDNENCMYTINSG